MLLNFDEVKNFEYMRQVVYLNQVVRLSPRVFKWVPKITFDRYRDRTTGEEYEVYGNGRWHRKVAAPVE